MLIGVISDTHGDVTRTRDALNTFAVHGVERIIHCGDIGTHAIIEEYGRWPTHFVAGNVDGDCEFLRPRIEELGQTYCGEFGSVDWEGCPIAFLHGHNSRRLIETISSGHWDLVCHGHTHAPKLERVGPTVVLNPGAVSRGHPCSVALVDLPSMQVQHLRLSDQVQ